jgi:imidazolonepropionase-like amidohydrolase
VAGRVVAIVIASRLISMRSGIVFATLALGSIVLSGQGQQLSPDVARYATVNAPLVALTNVRVVDGTGTPARVDQTILLNGPRIQAIGSSSTITLPPTARVLDLPGHTVIPGIVGLHEHTYFGGVKRLTQMRVSGPLLYLAHGVTTAMTAGSQLPYHELHLKNDIDNGQIAGPRFLIAGPYLDGEGSRGSMNRKIMTREDARRVIGYWASEGATWVKVQGRISRGLLRETIEEAHARGLRVTGHLCSVTFTEAAALGIDALQHGFITNSDYVTQKRPDECPPENMRVQADVDVASAPVQQSIREIVKHKTAVVSTLGVYESFIAGHVIDPRGLEWLDPETRQEVLATNAEMAKSDFAVPPRLLQKMMQWERAFVAAGGLLAAGSDPWGTGFMPGLGNLRNFELLVQAGFTPEQAIQILTLNGARVLDEDSLLGSVARGKTADLVVINGNPVARPADIYHVVTVFKDGIGYDSAKLRQDARGKVGTE